MHRSLTIVVLVALLASVGFFAGAESAHAQFTACSSTPVPLAATTTCSGPATKYLLTLLAFKLRPSVGADHILVSSSQPCDAGAVAQNTEACQFGGSNLIIPADTYTGFVLEINRTFVASGTGTLPAPDNRSCTATDTSTTIDVPPSGGGTTFEAFGVNNLRAAVTLASSVTLTGDVTVDFTITLNVGAGALYTFPADILQACSSTAAGPLSMSLGFKCIAGPCPSQPQP